MEETKKLDWKAKRLRLTLNLRRKFNIRRKNPQKKGSKSVFVTFIGHGWN